MFVWFAPEGTKSAGTTEVAPGIMLDYDAAGNVIGIEVPDVRARVSGYVPPGMHPKPTTGLGFTFAGRRK